MGGKIGKANCALPTFLPILGNPKKRDSHIPILTAAEKRKPIKIKFEVTLTQDEKCQPCARSKVSTIPPAAQIGTHSCATASRLLFLLVEVAGSAERSDNRCDCWSWT
jgi:hypothetical protein